MILWVIHVPSAALASAGPTTGVLGRRMRRPPLRAPAEDAVEGSSWQSAKPLSNGKL